MSQQTVSINGTLYDAHTGMPIDKRVDPAMPLPQSDTHSQAVHQVTQKSQTLNRRIVEKTAPTPVAVPRPQPQQRQIVQKSPAITKFAPHPRGVTPQTRVMSDIGPIHHPMVKKVHQQMQPAAHTVQVQEAAPKPSQIIKQEAIAEALEKAPSHNKQQKQVKKPKRYSRSFGVASASLALLLLGGYFTYLNMPSLSVRVAAAQAGVNASYPEYRPDGYSLRGPVAYNEGEVSMKFAANGGPQNFSITQTKSSWDSSALEENYVDKASNGGYVPYIERGIKIYVFDNNAAWVNGGVLYKITGDAPLSNDQIRRIATSM